MVVGSIFAFVVLLSHTCVLDAVPFMYLVVLLFADVLCVGLLTIPILCVLYIVFLLVLCLLCL